MESNILPYRFFFAFPDAMGIKSIPYFEILYFIASSNYATIHLKNGNTILLSKPLSWIEERLPAKIFLRIHQSYLINLNYLNEYNRLERMVKIVNGMQIPVSVRQTSVLRKALLTPEFV
ncbi:MAG: LytTR family transcriptional regulator [Bacteroidetes bacterium]|nr:LytTR family transcriptional regulator [Bacteroidota bacterium]